MKHTKEKMMKALVLSLIHGEMPADLSLIPEEYRTSKHDVTGKHVTVFSTKEISQEEFETICQSEQILLSMVFAAKEIHSIVLNDLDEHIICAIISSDKLI